MEPQQPNNTPPPPAWTQYKPPAQPPMYPPQPMQPMQQRRTSGVFVPTAVIVILAIAAVVVMCASSVFGYAIGVTPVHATPTTDTSNASLTTQQAVQTPTIVLHVTGQGSTETGSFTVSGTWQLQYTCSGTSDLLVDVYRDSESNALTGMTLTHGCPLSPKTADASATFHTGGTFYLAIFGTEETYDLTVTDLPG